MTGVELFDELPAGAAFVGASDGGRLQDGRIHWLLGQAPAGRNRSVTVEMKAAKEGEAVNRVTAKADRGVTASAEAKTLFAGMRASTCRLTRRTSWRSAARAIT